MKLIIDIDENVFTRLFDNGREDYMIVNDDLYAIAKSIRKGTPLDDVKAEINYERNLYLNLVGDSGYCNGLNKALKIIDNIGKVESEGE